MISYELTMTQFTQVILFLVGFLSIFLYLCAMAIRTVKGNLDFHTQKYAFVPKSLLFITVYFLNHHQKTDPVLKKNSDDDNASYKNVIINELEP